MEPSPTPSSLYKIVTMQEFASVQSTFGTEAGWLGSSIDHRDGFIHLSTAQQAPLVASNFYDALPQLVLLKVPYQGVRSQIKWEPAVHPIPLQDGKKVDGDAEAALFPHLYGPLLLPCLEASYEVIDRPNLGYLRMKPVAW